MSEYWHIVSSSLRPRGEPDISRDCVDFKDRWHAAIKEAVRANHNSVMVNEAFERDEASLDDLIEAGRWKAAADAALSAIGQEYRRRRDD